jgi:hypothetical protein
MTLLLLLFSIKTINCLDIHQSDRNKQLSLYLSLIFKRFYSYIQLHIFFMMIYQNVGKKYWILWKERNENDPLKSPTKICGSMFPFRFFWIFFVFSFFWMWDIPCKSILDEWISWDVKNISFYFTAAQWE